MKFKIKHKYTKGQTKEEKYMQEGDLKIPIKEVEEKYNIV